MIRSVGVRVPEDFSEAGYVDYRTIAEMLYPPLTKVELPYFDMGKATARTALTLISGDHALPGSPQVVSGLDYWRSSVTSLNKITRLNPERRRMI